MNKTLVIILEKSLKNGIKNIFNKCPTFGTFTICFDLEYVICYRKKDIHYQNLEFLFFSKHGLICEFILIEWYIEIPKKGFFGGVMSKLTLNIYLKIY